MIHLRESILGASAPSKLIKDMEDGQKIAIENIKKFVLSPWWPWSKDYTPDVKNSKKDITYEFGCDDKGYYIETFGLLRYMNSGNLSEKDFVHPTERELEVYNHNQTLHREGTCPPFRWKKHTGNVMFADQLQCAQSIKGIPEDSDIHTMFFGEMFGCQSRGIDLGKHKIKHIRLHNCGDITLTGHPKVDEISWTRSYNSRRPKVTFPCKSIYQEE